MLKVLQPFVSLALKSFFHAVDTMLHRHDHQFGQVDQEPRFNFSLNCQGVDSNHRWEDGPEFHRQLLETTLTMKRHREEKLKIFNNDGTLKDTELKIMNFRPLGNNQESKHEIKMWEEVSYQSHIFHLKMIHLVFFRLVHGIPGTVWTSKISYGLVVVTCLLKACLKNSTFA